MIQFRDLWSAWQEEGDEEARELLTRQHLRLVHHIARRMLKRLSSDASLDDLVSAGTMGLLRAIDGYDSRRGIRFSTFAAPRIRGAILDDLRRADAAPRAVRRRQKEVAAARESLSRSLSREPTLHEISQELEVNVDTLWEWESGRLAAERVSLHEPLRGTDGRGLIRADMIGTDGDDADELLNQAQEISLVKRAIDARPERERIVLTLYYYEGLKQSEIAAVLDVTESRVSQIRTKGIQALRTELAGLRPTR